MNRGIYSDAGSMTNSVVGKLLKILLYTQAFVSPDVLVAAEACFLRLPSNRI